ncbi:hypothetical protein B0H11DRAFT_2268733 [Mycena galericulata]|nr:hypothetical protein B0H11DRAFT_2268733 [Mycena galericulata]
MRQRSGNAIISELAKRGDFIVFGLTIFYGIIELSLAAWLTCFTERDRVRFTLFTSTWTVVFSALFLILFAHSTSGSILTSVLSHLVFLGLTFLLWTASAAAVSSSTAGSQLNALEAFAWIKWILVTFAIVVVIVRGIGAARRGDGYRGGSCNCIVMFF